MAAKIQGEYRPLDQLKEQYEIEKELAGRLRNANKEERRRLYTVVYDELYLRVPHHPQLTQKSSREAQSKEVSAHLRLLKRFLRPECTFLEIGPGDCSLSFEVARLVRKVYAVDVSNEITRSATKPGNFELIISDGCSIPVPKNSVNVAYSNQLMEHLHPDDALDQLRNIYAALAPGGIYICMTPNRLSGPHDISRYFDEVATGFHLKEYTTTELANIFKQVGFSKVQVLVPLKRWLFLVPVFPVIWLEAVLIRLPRSLSNWLSKRFLVKKLFGKLVTTK